MSKKKNRPQRAPKEGQGARQDVLDNLPRSITPIGIFFGHGAKRDASSPQPGLFGKRRERRRRNAMGTPLQQNVVSVAVAVLFALVWFIVSMPSLNIRDSHFWTMLMLAAAAFLVVKVYVKGTPEKSGQPGEGMAHALFENFGAGAVVAGAIAFILIIGNLSSWVLVRGRAYAHLVTYAEGNATADLDAVDEATLPMLDPAAAALIAQEALDATPELAGTFALSEMGSQILLHGELAHVFPLDYASFQLNMRGAREGIPAYVVVRDHARSAEVVMVEGRMRFGSANYLMGDINRHVRLAYPGVIFRDTHFEIDDDGAPFWVSSVMEKTVGLFGGDNVAGIIVTDAVSGQSRRYALDEIPAWVDSAFSAGLLLTQFNNYGIYRNGFFNAITSKVGVMAVSNGYGYAVLGGELHVCAGVSAVSDVRTTVGYLYINQRTKQTVLFPIAGNDEVAAQTAALEVAGPEDSISSYPVLVSAGGVPTYCMCIMDEGFAFKDVALVSLDSTEVVAVAHDAGECLGQYGETAGSARAN